LHGQVDFLFQAAFAAPAATIVSGAVAGRMKFAAYMIYTVVLTGVIYPISGFWKWGGGWLDQMGFYDFAGSILVHAVGGFAGLAGAIVLGPRIGRFGKDKIGMPGHNLTFAALGVFILLIGWFGFNPGSQLAIASVGDTEAVMLIAVNTTLAAAAGAVFALLFSWVLDKKPDLTMALNGILAGLVGITALPDGVTNWEAIIIGGIAGLIVVGGIKLLESLKIDDPVGAFPVHGLCGLWGGIAVAIFGDYGEETGSWAAQLTGTIVIPVFAFATMFILFSILKAVGLLRVSEEDEMVGLDLSEHGQSAYGE
jgi:Amt family ammonium transporter